MVGNSAVKKNPKAASAKAAKSKTVAPAKGQKRPASPKGKKTPAPPKGKAEKKAPPKDEKKAPAKKKRKSPRKFSISDPTANDPGVKFHLALLAGEVDPLDIPKLVPMHTLDDMPSPQLMQAVVAAVQQGIPAHTAAKAIGIHLAALRRWISQGVTDILNQKLSVYCDFVRSIEAAEAQAVIADVQMMRAGVKHGPLLLEILGRRYPQEWGPKATMVESAVQLADVRQEAQRNTPEFTQAVLEIQYELGLLTPGQAPEEEKKGPIEVKSEAA